MYINKEVKKQHDLSFKCRITELLKVVPDHKHYSKQMIKSRIVKIA